MRSHPHCRGLKTLKPYRGGTSISTYCYERQANRGGVGGLALLLAVANPAAHSALLAPNFTTSFTSSTTGHAFSSGGSVTVQCTRSEPAQRGRNPGESRILYARPPSPQDLRSRNAWERTEVQDFCGCQSTAESFDKASMRAWVPLRPSPCASTAR